MECPNCAGCGYVYGLKVKIPCPICNGTGNLPADIDYLPERGRTLKESRLSQETTFISTTLRNYCKDHSIDATERSRQERGFFEKGR
ncbi:MAG: hypothetical protein Q8J68_14560 [Methanolobus sp.]|uniref:hypothetical protein n=1 Tax=Methanolobus sp. TaxID=1874737 RepID=UPI00272FB61B|nr:hypothetical protein [Methanolobus sp.]MDP2218496.1 hypothetical protein [Methanolobus sp.]